MVLEKQLLARGEKERANRSTPVELLDVSQVCTVVVAVPFVVHLTLRTVWLAPHALVTTLVLSIFAYIRSTMRLTPVLHRQV